MAPSLSRVPLFIRPIFELERREQQKERELLSSITVANASARPILEVARDAQLQENMDPTKQVDNHAGKPQDCGTCPSHVSNEDFIDVFDTQEDINATLDSCVSPGNSHDENQEPSTKNKSRQIIIEEGSKDDIGEWHMELDEEFFSTTTAANARPRFPNQSKAVPSTSTSQKREDEATKRRKQMQQSVTSYLRKPIDLANVAHSKEKIRRNGDSDTKASTGGPNLEIFIIVSEYDDDQDSLNDEGETSSQDLDSIATNEPELDRSKAKIMLIRMVNRIPLLDGAEASACGLVRGLQKKTLWNSYGLDISPMVEQSTSCPQDHNSSVPTALHVPTFSLGDSAHVAPFFSQSNTHTLFSDDESSDNEEGSEDDSAVDHERMNKSGKRKRNRNLALKPAGLRLGNILIVVQLNAKSSQLPLPTLSKVIVSCVAEYKCLH